MTHKERVLDLLSDGEPHTHHELYALHVIAHSRIADLRRDGHQIEQWRDGDNYLYRLTALAETEPSRGRGSVSASTASGGPSVPQPSLPAGANGWASPAGNEGVPGAALQLFDVPVQRERFAA